MSSILDDFFGNGDKVCACGETKNLEGFAWDAQKGQYGIYMCPKCKAEADAQRAARIEADRKLGARIEANTEDNDQ